MIKSMLTIAALTTVGIVLAHPEEPGENPDTSPSADSITLTDALHQGMTMTDVQQLLGCQGDIWKVERIEGGESGDPLAWNVEWQISYIYRSATTAPDQIVSFGAWDTEGSSDRPPNSAFRLTSWEPMNQE